MENKKTDYASTSESVDDMLANVGEFIQGVYRDLNIRPQHTASLENSSAFLTRRSINEDSSVSSTNTSPVGAASLSNAPIANENTTVVSPTTRRNMDAEIERINLICNNVDRNLRSIGLFMNNSSGRRSTSQNILNSNLTSTPSLPTPYILSHDSPTLSTILLNSNFLATPLRYRASSIEVQPPNIIDLSDAQTQTPVRRQPIQQNNMHVGDDDDVILVSGNINPVVDLCTPGGYRESSNSRSSINQRQINRRRLPQPLDATCFQEPSSTRRRRIENLTPPEYRNIASELSNVETPPSAGVPSPESAFKCPVCMESCLPRQPTSTRCGHVYCKECIERSIRATHKCPMCNFKVTKNQIFRIYP